MSDSNAITELEIRLAYLEDNLATLDDVVTKQADYIRRLEVVQKKLYENIERLQASIEESGPEDQEPPPHY